MHAGCMPPTHGTHGTQDERRSSLSRSRSRWRRCVLPLWVPEHTSSPARTHNSGHWGVTRVATGVRAQNRDRLRHRRVTPRVRASRVPCYSPPSVTPQCPVLLTCSRLLMVPTPPQLDAQTQHELSPNSALALRCLELLRLSRRRLRNQRPTRAPHRVSKMRASGCCCIQSYSVPRQPSRATPRPDSDPPCGTSVCKCPGPEPTAVHLVLLVRARKFEERRKLKIAGHFSAFRLPSSRHDWLVLTKGRGVVARSATQYRAG